MLYKGLAGETMLKRARLLEDKFMEKGLCMNHRFSVHYVIPEEHQNDKRMLGQEGRMLLSKTLLASGETSAWEDTHVARGRFPFEVELLRVRDMIVPGQSPADKDRNLGPGERITQRGMAACKKILTGLLTGLTLEPGAKVVVANLCPHRVDEFGAAVWKMKQEDQLDIAYCSIVCDDVAHIENVAKAKKMLMNDWWDTCVEAGPREPSANAAVLDAGPTMRLASWVTNNPVLPLALLDKFEDGTPQHKAVMEKMEKFWTEFGKHGLHNLEDPPKDPSRPLGQGPEFEPGEKTDFTGWVDLTIAGTTAEIQAKPDDTWFSTIQVYPSERMHLHTNLECHMHCLHIRFGTYMRCRVPIMCMHIVCNRTHVGQSTAYAT
jgi:hypothetical protein